MIYEVTVKTKNPKGYNSVTVDIEAHTRAELNDLIGSVVLARIPDIKNSKKLKIKIKLKQSKES